MGHEQNDDPGELIANGLVEHLNEHPLSLEFTAENPEDITAAYEAERPSLTVLLGPFEETSEHIDRGGTAVETFETTVVVIRKLSPEFPRQRLSQFTRELKLSLRGVHLNFDGTIFRWVGDTTVTKFDPEKIRVLRQFNSVMRIRHIGITQWPRT